MACRRNLLATRLTWPGLEAAIAQLVRRDGTCDPSRAGIWANLGLLLKDDGRFDEALAYDIAPGPRRMTLRSACPRQPYYARGADGGQRSL